MVLVQFPPDRGVIAVREDDVDIIRWPDERAGEKLDG